VSPETRRLLVAWAPAALYMGIIWVVSSIEQPNFPVARFPFRDKGVHATEYAVLAFLLGHACVRTFTQHPRIRVALAALLLTVLWGFLDEMHQAFVPGRSADVLDLCADSIGGLVGVGARMALGVLAARRSAPGGGVAA
jgi:VanZ family protein